MDLTETQVPEGEIEVDTVDVIESKIIELDLSSALSQKKMSVIGVKSKHDDERPLVHPDSSERPLRPLRDLTPLGRPDPWSSSPNLFLSKEVPERKDPVPARTTPVLTNGSPVVS